MEGRMEENYKFNTIDDAIESLKKGELIIVVDDENRENEGDLLGIAELVTPEKVNFMIKEARGLLCVPLDGKRVEELNLQMMADNNSSKMGTNFTISVDLREGTTTGISAYDRAKTIKALADPKYKAHDFARPGHVFPLRAANGGVLRRAGHTEAAVDLAKLAGFYPAGYICEIVDDSGEMARLPKLFQIAKKFNLKIITVRDLISYRLKKEKLIELIVDIPFPSKYGKFHLYLFEDQTTGDHHLALVKGKISSDEPALVRVHSQCLTGDVLGSLRCDCGDQLHNAMQMIDNNGKGILLYLRQEGRGIGLKNKILAYSLQDKGYDTVEANLKLGFPADLRDYGIGAQILKYLGVRKIKLITNNPKKIVGLDAYGLEIVDRVPLVIQPNEVNKKYLLTKKTKLGHFLNFDTEENDA